VSGYVAMMQELSKCPSDPRSETTGPYRTIASKGAEASGTGQQARRVGFEALCDSSMATAWGLANPQVRIGERVTRPPPTIPVNVVEVYSGTVNSEQYR